MVSPSSTSHKRAPCVYRSGILVMNHFMQSYKTFYLVNRVVATLSRFIASAILMFFWIMCAPLVSPTQEPHEWGLGMVPIPGTTSPA